MPGYLAAKKRARFDFDAVGQFVQRFKGGVSQAVQLRCYGSYGMEGKPSRQASFDTVHCGHQEMRRAHGDVGAAEVKERIGQLSVVTGFSQRFEPGDVVVERRF